jgi:cytochrome P450
VNSTIPTAPGKLPLIGHALPLISRPIDFVTSLRDHGDVVRIFLGRVPTYFVTDARIVHRMLTTDSDKYTRGRVFDKARRFFGESVAIVSGQEHRAKRRMLQPAFASSRMPDYLAVMNRTVAEHAMAWRDGGRIDVADQMHELSAVLLATSLFGAHLTDAEVADICRCANIVMRGAYIRTVLPTAFDLLPLPTNRRFAKAIARLRDIVGRLIILYRSRQIDNEDLLSLLLNTGDMTDQEICDEIMTILVGGLGNTTAALAWTFYELANNPAATARLHREVDTVLGGGPVGMAELSRLTFTRRCIDEAVRPRGVWLLIRRTLVPAELGEVRIPAGAEVMYSLTALHRDPRFFPEPTKFAPDRALPEQARQVYLPFGAGPHKCVGEHFGTTATTVAVATIASTWHLLPVPGRRTREVVDATVRPDQLLMTTVRRPTAPTPRR